MIGAACVVAVAVLAQHVPGGARSEGAPRAVAVEPGETTLVCPAPARLVQEDIGDAEFDATPVETESRVRIAAAAPGVVGLGDDTDSAPEPDGSETENGGSGTEDDGVPQAGTDTDTPTATAGEPGQVVRAAPGEFAAATATSVTTQGDLRGLVAGACREPAIEHWMVGGSTDIGSSSRLVLQNPGRTAASVSLAVWGPAGPVTLGSKALVVVPPGEQVETSLEAIAPEQPRVVVRATSQGAHINASVQHHRIDGLVPQGADLVVPGAAPSSALALAGVVSTGESMDDPHAPLLRLLTPGDEDGSARVSVYGADGQVWPRGVEDVALEAGTVTDVPLGGLPEGEYAIAVDATVPVVAAGLTHHRGEAARGAVIEEEPYDVAWIPASPLSRAGSETTTAPADATTSGATAAATPGTAPVLPLAVPAGTAWSLNVAAIPASREDDADASPAADITVTSYAADGTTTGTEELTLPAGHDTTLSADGLPALGDDVAAVAVASTKGSPITWSLRLTAGATLAAALTPPDPATSSTHLPVRDVVAN